MSLGGGASRQCFYDLTPSSQYQISIRTQMQEMEGPSVSITDMTRMLQMFISCMHHYVLMFSCCQSLFTSLYLFSLIYFHEVCAPSGVVTSVSKMIYLLYSSLTEPTAFCKVIALAYLNLGLFGLKTTSGQTDTRMMKMVFLLSRN